MAPKICKFIVNLYPTLLVKRLKDDIIGRWR